MLFDLDELFHIVGYYPLIMKRNDRFDNTFSKLTQEELSILTRNM